MRTVQDKHFDLAVVDPPYGWGKQLKGRNVSGATDWNVAPTPEYFNELRRVSKHQIIWGGNYFGLPAQRHFIIWDKKQPIDNFARCEYAWSSLECNAEVFEYSYYGNINSEVDRFHPTQKPVKLYQYIFERHATRDMKILDTHLGGGQFRNSRPLFRLQVCGLRNKYRVLQQGVDSFQEQHHSK